MYLNSPPKKLTFINRHKLLVDTFSIIYWWILNLNLLFMLPIIKISQQICSCFNFCFSLTVKLYMLDKLLDIVIYFAYGNISENKVHKITASNMLAFAILVSRQLHSLFHRLPTYYLPYQRKGNRVHHSHMPMQLWLIIFTSLFIHLMACICAVFVLILRNGVKSY